MALLPLDDLLSVAGEFASQSTVPLSKPDYKEALAAADAWLQDNAASFNTALPAKARANLAVRQKAMILALVALRRAKVL